jgi:transposase
MEKIMNIGIGEKLYHGGQVTAQALISIARGKYKKEKKCAIIAVETGDYIDLKKEEYTSKDAFRKAIHEYQEKGFKVHFVNAG